MSMKSHKQCADVVIIECKTKDNETSCKPLTHYNECSNFVKPSNNYFNDYQIKKDLLEKGLEINNKFNNIFNNANICRYI